MWLLLKYIIDQTLVVLVVRFWFLDNFLLFFCTVDLHYEVRLDLGKTVSEITLLTVWTYIRHLILYNYLVTIKVAKTTNAIQIYLLIETNILYVYLNDHYSTLLYPVVQALNGVYQVLFCKTHYRDV